MKLISWNIGHHRKHWYQLEEVEADVALLQEACEPPKDVAHRFNIDVEPWHTEGDGARRRWRTAIIGLKGGLEISRFKPRALAIAKSYDLAVSQVGTLSAAEITDPGTGKTISLVSMYAPWQSPHASTGKSWSYADASAHRLISDISTFVGRKSGHRLIAAGDLNVLHGYGERGNQYWAGRYRTIFDRFDAIGLRFVGPQFPDGHQVDPPPKELPVGSKNVPTFRTNRLKPASATRQLDFVFASVDLAGRVSARALNGPDEWGSGDHCRVAIDVQ